MFRAASTHLHVAQSAPTQTRSIVTYVRKAKSKTAAPNATSPSRRPRSATGRNAPAPVVEPKLALPGPLANAKGSKRAKSLPANPAPRKVDGTPAYPLEPHVLSGRLKELCAASKVDDAVALLKNAPLDAQNTQVWNTLIWESMKAHRWALAYKLFTDMKRRGLKPSLRTFGTMFSGLSRIEPEQWSSHTKQLQNAFSLWTNCEVLLDGIKHRRPTDEEAKQFPLVLASYIKLLGDAGEHRKLFDVYNTLDTSGPMAPDVLVYTALFRALGQRTDLPTSSTSPLLPTPASSAVGADASIGTRDNMAAPAQNAADAKLLWRSMASLFSSSISADPTHGPRYRVDSHVLAEALRVLAPGRPSDQTFALELVRDHLGLQIPGDPTPPAHPALKEGLPHLMNPHTLQAALALAHHARRPALAPALLQQVLDAEDAARARQSRAHRQLAAGRQVETVVDRGHCEHALRAHAAQRDGGASAALELVRWMARMDALVGRAQLRPTAATYNLALSAAWRGADWPVARTLWEMMTGWKAGVCADGAAPDEGAQSKRRDGRIMDPDAEAMSLLARTAVVLGARDKAAQRQGVRMLEQAGVQRVLEGKDGAGPDAGASLRMRKHHAFFRAKLAGALRELVDSVLPSREVLAREKGKPVPLEQLAERERWMALREAAVKMLVQRPEGAEAKAAEAGDRRGRARTTSPYAKETNGRMRSAAPRRTSRF